MIIVIDASVAIKWFLSFKPDEDHADLALNLLAQIAQGDLKLVQPPHFIAEVAAVLARLKPDEAQDDLLDLLNIAQRILDTPEIHATALELAIRHQHHLFDTLYHAVALHTPGATLITADRRYYDKAKAEGRIVLLAEWASDQPDEYPFDRTIVPVRLAIHEGEMLVSRSQAKLLIQGFERCKHVTLDFDGVNEIGQAFSDEVFRVFQAAHPDIIMAPVNMMPAVQAMVSRAKAKA